jgi:hypothetical protein
VIFKVIAFLAAAIPIFLFVRSTPCDSVYRARDLHRLLFRDVLDGLALCRPCHRT